MATDTSQPPVFREIDMAAETRKILGKKWNEPSPSYEFSSGRKFVLRTEDAGIYETSPDF